MNRFLPSFYADDRQVPRGGYQSSHNNCKKPRPEAKTKSCQVDNHAELPNPRKVSTQLHYDLNKEHPNVTHLFVQFGQFVDHDINFVVEGEMTNCCEFPDQDGCFPIYIPCDDPHFVQYEPGNRLGKTAKKAEGSNFDFLTMLNLLNKQSFRPKGFVKGKKGVKKRVKHENEEEEVKRGFGTQKLKNFPLNSKPQSNQVIDFKKRLFIIII